jgi:hypothetical protein
MLGFGFFILNMGDLLVVGAGVVVEGGCEEVEFGDGFGVGFEEEVGNWIVLGVLFKPEGLDSAVEGVLKLRVHGGAVEEFDGAFLIDNKYFLFCVDVLNESDMIETRVINLDNTFHFFVIDINFGHIPLRIAHKGIRADHGLNNTAVLISDITCHFS